MVITLQDMLRLDRCPEWTNDRTTAFFGKSGEKTLAEFVAAVGTEDITHEEIYWGLVHFITPKQRQQWSAEMLQQAELVFRDLAVRNGAGKGKEFERRQASQAERKAARDAIKAAHDSEFTTTKKVTKRVRFRYLGMLLHSNTTSISKALKIAGVLIAEHDGFSYADLNARLQAWLEAQ